MPEDPWGLFDRSGSPDDRPGYPPVPDVDFALFPSACRDVLLQDDAAWAVRTFDQARRATMLWLELRRGIEKRHGPSPRHAHAFLDTLVAPCVTEGFLAVSSHNEHYRAVVMEPQDIPTDCDAVRGGRRRLAGRLPAGDARRRSARPSPPAHGGLGPPPRPRLLSPPRVLLCRGACGHHLLRAQLLGGRSAFSASAAAARASRSASTASCPARASASCTVLTACSSAVRIT